MERQAVHWRNAWDEPACHVTTVTLPIRTTRDPKLVRCERCMVLIPKYLAMARDDDSLTFSEI